MEAIVNNKENINKIEFSFGTKAETLLSLRPFLKNAVIGDVFHFTVEKWNSQPELILKEVTARFLENELVAVRSSAQGEDGHGQSMAGAYHSCLNIDCTDEIQLIDAINKVIGSYNENLNDQILIQPMISDIAVSAVIMTRNLEDGSPYYVFNYDDYSGKTNTITSGNGVHKTVYISHRCNSEYIESNRLKQMLTMVYELEEICKGVPLDIECGLKSNGDLYLFQVRPISVWKNWNWDTTDRILGYLPEVEAFVKEQSQIRKGLYGRRTILATMPDWNPAEIIGTTPRPLAISLYRELITKDIWRKARAKMGYRNLPDVELMVTPFGRPFIDVRASFNSFLPEELDSHIGEKLINAWLDRLEKYPEFHDKVEFEIVQSCLDFTFEEDFDCRYENLLSAEERGVYRRILTKLTKKCISLKPDSTLIDALNDIDNLAELQQQRIKIMSNKNSNIKILHQLLDLINECRDFGTSPFSIIARHAFIAESFLRSAIKRGAMTDQRVKKFKKSLKSITTELAADFDSVSKGKLSQTEFLQKYGHLRPGTYDIRSLSYAQRNDLFDEKISFEGILTSDPFKLTSKEINELNKLLREIKLTNINAEGLLEYARKAIIGREYAKFVFTRNISDILDGLSQWGKSLSFTPNDISFLDIQNILEISAEISNEMNCTSLQDMIDQAKTHMRVSKEIKLSYILRGVRDVYVVPVHRSEPNFISSIHLEGNVVVIDTLTSAHIDLKDKIICIENADPGFDWIFTKGIKSLITKYGGVNSHMAIRCAEFGLPAAIGCGEETFERIIKAGRVELNCAERILRPIYG